MAEDELNDVIGKGILSYRGVLLLCAVVSVVAILGLSCNPEPGKWIVERKTIQNGQCTLSLSCYNHGGSLYDKKEQEVTDCGDWRINDIFGDCF